jgi:hypothetical protein
LRWRTDFESRQRFFSRCQPPQLDRYVAGAVLA